MKLTITEMTQDLFVSLDVPEDMELENFRALVSHDTNIPDDRMDLLFDGNKMTDNKKTLAAYGIKDHDMVLIQLRQAPPPAQGSSNSPVAAAAANAHGLGSLLSGNGGTAADISIAIGIYQKVQASAEHLTLLRQGNPYLAEAFDKGQEEFVRVFLAQKGRKDEQSKRIKMMTSANADFNVEAQKMIFDEIQRQMIESNLETAMEHLPESFGQVHMLYIDLKVDGHPVKAFVDSGAQSTMISKACAERCNIMRLADTRFGGMAHGVGTQKILGKIHLTQIEIGGKFLPASFMVLENQPMDILLGLDLLKSHTCCIDLQRNVLRIGTTGTETPFLSESEIPKRDLLGGSPIDDLPSTSRSGQTNTPTLNEKDVYELVSKGFPREKVVEELKIANGDKTKALAALLAKSLTF